MMREAQIKRALISHLEAAQANFAGLFIEELELNGGEVRADLVDVQEMHCYEIKSEADSLRRLIGQGSRYGWVFERITLVLAERHLKNALPMLPLWWGVMIVPESESSAFRQVRAAKRNKRQEPEVLATLFKRDEAIQVLEEMGLARGWRSKSLYLIQAHLASVLSLEELKERVRDCLMRRVDSSLAPTNDLFSIAL